MQSEAAIRLHAENACIQFSDWIGDRSISTVGTNAGARTLPFQTWRSFKEAFAPEIVERALSESAGSVRHIADPFGGSGTTALAAQFFGVRPTTIEVNPFLADLIEAKIAPLDFDLAAESFGQVVECVARGCEPKRPVFPGASATFIEPGRNGRYIFSRAVARRFLAYRTAIELVQDEACQRLFRVVLASTAIPASNVVVSGKGRRYRQCWRERESPPRVVDELFRDGVLRALHDLRRFAARRCLDYRVLRGDARTLVEQIGPHDLAVFSPPYPNSFDWSWSARQRNAVFGSGSVVGRVSRATRADAVPIPPCSAACVAAGGGRARPVSRDPNAQAVRGSGSVVFEPESPLPADGPR